MKPESPVTLRTPTVSDAGEMARVHTEVWLSTYGGTVPEKCIGPQSMSRRRGHWENILLDRVTDQNITVAVFDSSIIGLAHCGIEDGLRKLFALYVLEAFRGCGVGKRLLDSVLTDDATELWVARDNIRAVKFYERNGFGPDGACEDFAAVGGFLTIRMVRDRKIGFCDTFVGR